MKIIILADQRERARWHGGHVQRDSCTGLSARGLPGIPVREFQVPGRENNS